MKKLAYILFAVSAIVFASCSKEVKPESSIPEAKDGIITFTASIELPAATKAALDGLAIKWSSGDYIGIATDNSSKIIAYPVTVGSTPTTCTINVAEVPGATAYYAIFRGSLGAGGDTEKEVAANSFKGITFDTATKTFSGLNVGKQQVAEGDFESYLWYSNGFPLAMAGKANGTSLVMRPCLALAKVQINSNSVPAAYYLNTDTYTSTKGIDHDHNYSAVRGFNLYQVGGSNPYSSGDFTVQVASDGTLTTSAVNNANKGEYRQISQSGKLTADQDYLMCLIPGGTISSFKFDFLGYKDNTGGLSWDAVYTMSLPASLTVNPGDFFDLGKLDPLTMKKAKNEAADEAIDEAAASFTPAITIDGDFTDWSGIAEYDGTVRGNGGSNTRVSVWKVTSDALYIYVYMKLVTEKLLTYPDRYIGIGFDTDQNDGTGSQSYNINGCEQSVRIYPAKASISPVEFVTGADPRSRVGSTTVGTLETWGVYDNPSSSTYSFVEVSIPRSSVGLSSAATIKIATSFDNYDTVKQVLVLN